VAEATLLQWKKKPSDAVAADEILIEIETDKVVLEVPAPAAGVLSQIVKGDGSTVVSGEVIASIDTEGKTAAAAAPAAAPAPAGARAASASATAGTVAMPAAAKLMADAGLRRARSLAAGRMAVSSRATFSARWQQQRRLRPRLHPRWLPRRP
jgi:2-oxoglutarate dehydrogenase E2 component (dihydrolipoamide succinyltransferase)